MEVHVARLIAACGLAQFQYRSWPAPEVAVPEAPVAAIPAETEPAIVAEPAPVMAQRIEMPAAAPPPVVLLPPDAPPSDAVRPRTPRAPVTLPPPEPLLPALGARGAGLPAGRPPVRLPAPEDDAPLVPLRPRERREGLRREGDPAPRRPADAPAAPRRFALLDEITRPGTPSRANAATPPRDSSPTSP